MSGHFIQFFSHKNFTTGRMNESADRPIGMTTKSSERKQTMKTMNRSTARAGLVVCSVLAVALTGCRTHVVHERTRTVYVPAPAPPPPVVHVVPEPVPQPASVVVVTPPATASVVVIQSENDFYEPLAVHGRWVVIGAYGRCWIPAHVETGWRPYSYGYWQRSDAGWYWVSEEPWGWATYHYGRWDWHAAHGWFWMPQTQWAPAWVAWREGGGYIGWAPLRPSVTIGVSIGRVDYEPAFASRAFVFVEHRRMLEPVRPKTVIVNNTTIINKTVNITNVKVVNKTVINEGPRPEAIERASGRKVNAVAAREFRRKEETPVAARLRNSPADRKRQVTERPELVAHAQSVTPKATVVEKPAVAVAPTTKAIPTPARATPPRTVAATPERKTEKSEATVNKTTTLPVKPAASPAVRPAPALPPQREIRPVEKPVVAAKPVPQPITRTPVREERKSGLADVRKPAPTPAVAPAVKPEVKPVVTVPTQRELRPVEKPAVVVRPTPKPVTTNRVRAEVKREPVMTSSNPVATPAAVAPKPRNEVRAQSRPAASPAAKVETARPSPPSAQSTPPTARPSNGLATSRSATAQTAERAEASTKNNDTPRSR
jgi:hypothetical protein